MDIVRRNTAVYYVTQILHSLIFTIPIWIVYYLRYISVAEMSFLITFAYIAQMVLELPSGALADLIGRRNVNLISFFITALGLFLFPLASTFWHFILLAFMVGLADSFRSGSEEALVYDTLKQGGQEKSYPKINANGNFLYQIGLITGAAIGGFLYSIHPAIPYLAYGLSAFIGGVVAFFYVEPAIDSVRFSLKNYRHQIIQGSKEAFKNTYTKYLTLYYIFVGGIAWSSTLYFNSYMMVGLGFDDTTRGLLTAGIRFINAFGLALLLKNGRIFNRTRTIIFFPLVMLLGYLPGVFVSGFWGVPFIQLAMIATTARWIILSPLTNAAFSSKYRATAISLLSLLIGFVYISLTTISGFVIPHYGIKTMYTLLGLVSLVTVVPLTLKLLQISRLKNKAFSSP